MWQIIACDLSTFILVLFLIFFIRQPPMISLSHFHTESTDTFLCNTTYGIGHRNYYFEVRYNSDKRLENPDNEKTTLLD